MINAAICLFCICHLSAGDSITIILPAEADGAVPTLSRILVIFNPFAFSPWQAELLLRLESHGHKLFVQATPLERSSRDALGCLISLESLRFGETLASLRTAVPDDKLAPDPSCYDVAIDLTGEAHASVVPLLTIEFLGHRSFSAGLTQMMASGRSMEIVTRLDGVAIGRARPMPGDRLWVSLAANNMLAGTITLIAQSIDLFNSGHLAPIHPASLERPANKRFLPAYLRFVRKGLFGRLKKKWRLGRRPFYWQVAYRMIDGAGVAERGELDGPPFAILADDGQRFYADPFVFEQAGHHYLFVEEFCYRLGRGIISVAELDIDGRFGRPRAVLSLAHHLSYPQVFALDGDIFMIPESSAAREVVLYRAERFPDLWVRDTVLLQDCDFNDATLVVQNGRLWLFGTQRHGRGSASDTMTAYSAAAITGPWLPHKRNPIAIDHSASRPGGAFIRNDNTLTLPVQNGSEAYGGGLGLMTLTRLDDDSIIFSAPRPIRPGAALARKGIHTLNRSGRLEVVDSAG